MKRIELKDVKPGHYWLKDPDEGSLDVVRVHEGVGGKLYYLFIGDGEASAVDETDCFFELIEPVEGQINLLHNEYDGESIVDMDRDVSEATNGDYNLKAQMIPEMEDSPGFWAGKFVVDITWVPDGE
jgi:hypothetical protein